MQYGLELSSYKRKKKDNMQNNTVDYMQYVMFVVIFAASILISRVILVNKTAPFGVAFIVSISMFEKKYIAMIAGLGSIIGYLTILTNISNGVSYIALLALVIVVDKLARGLNTRKRLIAIFLIMIIENGVYNFLINSYSSGVSALITLFDVLCILPLYFIMNYSIVCIKGIKEKRIFTNEEIISMAILFALIISGCWGISIAGVTIRNILALLFVIIIAFVCGSSGGSAAGVVVGVILGMPTTEIMIYISVCGVTGLIVGLFKETGKIISIAACFISFCILKFYTDMNSEFKVVEAIIALILFLGIPQKIYDKLSMELDGEKKVETINKIYIDTLKNIMATRLNSFSDLLFNMSHIVKNIVGNDKLMLKSKGSAMVENLADRVCANCSMNTMCWKREIHYTYNGFEELINSFQEGQRIVPREIERKCVKLPLLLRNADEIVTNHMINELCRKKLIEGREIVGGHLNNIAQAIGDAVNEFGCEIKVNRELENQVKKALNKKSIEYSSILCYENKKQRVHLDMHMSGPDFKAVGERVLTELISQVVGVQMHITGSSTIDKSGMQNIRFEETPKYNMSTYVARACKDGENYSGDSFTFGKLNNSDYMIVISDGMGSGPQARAESKAAVDLIERLTSAGLSLDIAIDTVNAVMNMKYSEEEKYSTIDVAAIDLFTGDARFMKVGAAATYIKNSSRVEMINSKTLPVGVLDDVDVDVFKRKVVKGDKIIMISDGVLECASKEVKMEKWLQYYLENCEEDNPKIIADEIMEQVVKANKGKIRDDITIIVSKIVL